MTTPPVTVWITTDADAEQMSWHDAQLYGARFLLEAAELAFDLDWPIQWMAPPEGSSYFRAWVSPATLVFHGVTGFQGNLDLPHDSTIIDLGVDPDQADELGSGVPTEGGTWWFMKTVVGHWRIRAQGFTQYLRARPVLTAGGTLGLELRRGVCFDRRTLDESTA